MSSSGKLYNAVQYGINDQGLIDYDEVERPAVEHKPKMIVAGFGLFPEAGLARFREIADKVGAYLFVDMAHVAGLVAAGVYPNPVLFADVVTTTTHKTLRGARRPDPRQEERGDREEAQLRSLPGARAAR